MQQALQQHIGWLNRSYVFCIPSSAADVRAFLYRHANVTDEDYAEDGQWVIHAEISDAEIGRLYGLDRFQACSIFTESEHTARVASC